MSLVFLGRNLRLFFADFPKWILLHSSQSLDFLSTCFDWSADFLRLILPNSRTDDFSWPILLILRIFSLHVLNELQIFFNWFFPTLELKIFLGQIFSTLLIHWIFPVGLIELQAFFDWFFPTLELLNFRDQFFSTLLIPRISSTYTLINCRVSLINSYQLFSFIKISQHTLWLGFLIKACASSQLLSVCVSIVLHRFHISPNKFFNYSLFLCFLHRLFKQSIIFPRFSLTESSQLFLYLNSSRC